jgi:spore maturation protein CgeB
MNLVVFGLSVSSSWGNGHASLWRGLIAALVEAGHRVSFFERDQPWYAEHRDLAELPAGGRLVLYRDWNEIRSAAALAVDEADAAIVTSYCPDAQQAAELVLAGRAPCRCFYDLDTPVTLARLGQGEAVDYVPRGGLREFDLVLSYTGGEALDALRVRLGARRVAPLYGSVDTRHYQPAEPQPQYRADLSYIGTYAEDRQAALSALLIGPARLRPRRRFLIAGAMYPASFPWTDNIFFVRHLPPAEHPGFYASCRLTLNVTRAAMARMGHCPSGRLFEAAACGTPVLSDWWPGLEAFFQPGSEILITRETRDTLGALDVPDATLAAIGRRARERVFAEHSAERRAEQMVALLESAARVGV